MSVPPVSHRTVIRDAVVAVFEHRRGQDGVRAKEYDVSPYWLALEECKRFPTYCVVATDEAPGERTQRHVDCALTLVVVIYAKDERDPRKALDAAIEDAYEAMLLAQATIDQEIAWRLTLDELTTDDGTKIAHPHAQAIQRWQCQHRRKNTVA